MVREIERETERTRVKKTKKNSVEKTRVNFECYKRIILSQIHKARRTEMKNSNRTNGGQPAEVANREHQQMPV